MSYHNAAAAYRRNAILTASPSKLIKLLYEGAITNLEKTRIELGREESKRGVAAGEALGRAYGIIGELRSALDFKAGGDIARKLDTLYEYGLHELTSANVTRDPSHIDHTLKVMRTLKEGWDVVLAG